MLYTSHGFNFEAITIPMHDRLIPKSYVIETFQPKRKIGWIFIEMENEWMEIVIFLGLNRLSRSFVGHSKLIIGRGTSFTCTRKDIQENFQNLSRQNLSVSWLAFHICLVEHNNILLTRKKWRTLIHWPWICFYTIKSKS